ncbi:hypothetical protein HAX54_048137, partial [Datura stramonium]|nr:hypothetical protein [Datura stramonium]
MNRHSRDICYKLVGYPNDNKFRKKNQGLSGGNGSVAYNVTTEDATNSSQKGGKFEYGQNTNIWNNGTFSKDNGTQTHNIKMQPMMINPFTKDRYEQIVHMLNQRQDSHVSKPMLNHNQDIQAAIYNPTSINMA